MASLIKRKKSYSLVYYYTDENGETKQKWETLRNYQDALKRKAEVENEINKGPFIPPNDQTVREFLYDFVTMYGEQKWSVSMYDGCTGLIENYINPLIGDLKIQSITTKTTYKKRDIWDAETIMKALNECDESKLYLAMNLLFACSLRIGEILGLTWDNVHISDEDIANDNAYVYIDKELERASKRSLEALGTNSVLYIFPTLFPNTSTRVVLKKPKTESSIRQVWLPKTLAYILREWKQAQDELKRYLGEEYQDYNLVVALPNGRPCEYRVITKEFEKLKEKADLPNVVFHSLRHSSTTYKLKLNNGDLKATQGDTGHSQIDMITNVYAHILDEDRKINAQKFETAFYGTRDLRDVKPPQEPAQEPQQNVDLASLIEQLQKNPELVNTLANLLSNGSTAKG